MFDDPKGDLQRLQEKLLAAEEAPQELPEEEFEEEPEEEADGGAETDAAPGLTEKDRRAGWLLAALLLELGALLALAAWWLRWR